MDNRNQLFDIQDSKSDAQRLEHTGINIELPEVSDIPGQEHIHAVFGSDQTGIHQVSSDDEEGVVNGDDILDEEEDVAIILGTEADVTEEDIELLGDPDEDLDLNEDEDANRRVKLDNTDFDGDPLNEDLDETGEDLIVPGSEDDDLLEEIGEEDEENNLYSLDEQDNDQDED
jgi:hypothetical protein